MIQVHTTEKGNKIVIASELHQKLNITTPLRKWFPRMIAYGFDEGIDYFRADKKVRAKKGGTQTVNDWHITLDMAKHIAMIQRTPKGKELRSYLLNLDKQITKQGYAAIDGKIRFTKEQTFALLEITQISGYISFSKDVQRQHKILHGNKYKWWKYRAELLGFSVDELKEAMAEIGKKHQNTYKSLMVIDKYEIFRMTAIDLFKLLGKSHEYAQNAGDIVKEMARTMKIDVYNDLDASIDFVPKEHKQLMSKIRNPRLAKTFG